jgi:hypothetical protein
MNRWLILGQKLAVYIAMVLFGIVLASAYGAIHNQLSYTISPEYFTRFKFIQFDLGWAFDHPRAGAAVVGVAATWWFGAALALVLGLFGFLFRTPKEMAQQLGMAYLLVVCVGFLTGLGGLVYAFVTVNAESVAEFAHWLPPNVSHPVQFVQAGTMHNSSYLGGIVGLLAAIIFLIVRRVRT